MKIAVIGGGASGMMAAICAVQNGAEVVLLERNEKLGKKLYITGKGRCNLTNKCDNAAFISNVVSNSKFLLAAISKWSAQDTINFFENKGLHLKVERGNRVFPVSDKSSDVIKVMHRELVDLGVNICLNTKVVSVECRKECVLVHTASDIVECDGVIIATGGLSYSTTGSSGDGYLFAKSIGHDIVEPRPALCEILVKQDVSCLNGISLKNVRLTASVDGREICSQLGEMLFTYRGVSGPIALTVSSFINRYPAGKVRLTIDLKPGLPYKSEANGGVSIESRLQKDFLLFTNKAFKNSLIELLPVRMADYIVRRTNIDPEIQVNSLNSVARASIADALKRLEFDVASLSDIEYGIVTAGGVSVSHVNPSTMQSKLCKRVFFAGEILDVDALTGGFNLQIAFSTGFVAGNSIVGLLNNLGV